MSSQQTNPASDHRPSIGSPSIRQGATVEVNFDGQWIGGYEVRHRYSTFVSVLDKAEGFFGGRYDVPLDRVRLPELPDPIWRDLEGDFVRIGPTAQLPLELA